MTILTLNKLLTNVAAHTITTGAIAFSELDEIFENISPANTSDRSSDILRTVLQHCYSGDVSQVDQVQFSEDYISGEFYDFSELGFTERYEFVISPDSIEYQHLATITPPEFEEVTELDFRAGLGEGKQCKDGYKLCKNPNTGYRYCIPEGWKCATERGKVPRSRKVKPTPDQEKQISDLIQQGTRKSKAKYAVGGASAMGKGDAKGKEKRSLLEGKVSEGKRSAKGKTRSAKGKTRSAKGKTRSAKLPGDKSQNVSDNRGETDGMRKDMPATLQKDNREDIQPHLLDRSSLESSSVYKLDTGKQLILTPAEVRQIGIDYLEEQIGKDEVAEVLKNPPVGSNIERDIRNAVQSVIKGQYQGSLKSTRLGDLADSASQSLADEFRYPGSTKPKYVSPKQERNAEEDQKYYQKALDRLTQQEIAGEDRLKNYRKYIEGFETRIKKLNDQGKDSSGVEKALERAKSEYEDAKKQIDASIKESRKFYGLDDDLKPQTPTSDDRTKLKTLASKLQEIYDDPRSQLDADGEQQARDRAYAAAFDTFGITDASVADVKGKSRAMAKIDLLKSKLGEMGIDSPDYLNQIRKLADAKSQSVSQNKGETDETKRDMQTKTKSDRTSGNIAERFTVPDTDIPNTERAPKLAPARRLQVDTEKFDQNELDNLSDSILNTKLQYPVVVQRDGANFKVLSGEKMAAAAQKARAKDLKSAENVNVYIANSDDEAKAYTFQTQFIPEPQATGKPPKVSKRVLDKVNTDQIGAKMLIPTRKIQGEVGEQDKDTVEAIAQSMLKVGTIMPIVVQRDGDGFKLLHGDLALAGARRARELDPRAGEMTRVFIAENDDEAKALVYQLGGKSDRTSPTSTTAQPEVLPPEVSKSKGSDRASDTQPVTIKPSNSVLSKNSREGYFDGKFYQKAVTQMDKLISGNKPFELKVTESSDYGVKVAIVADGKETELTKKMLRYSDLPFYFGSKLTKADIQNPKSRELGSSTPTNYSRELDHSDIRRVKPTRSASAGEVVKLKNGDRWEYKGFGYDADNRSRVNGWEKLD